jgi:hypothetical protein
MRVFKFKKFTIPVALAIVALVPACGVIKPGTGAINEAEPSGFQRVATAPTFFAQNGNLISGSVGIYFKKVGSTESFVIRLENFEVETQEFGLLRIKVVAGGSTVLNTALKGTSGNHNYVPTSSMPGSKPTFTSATIGTGPKSGFPVGETYGTANFGSMAYPP